MARGAIWHVMGGGTVVLPNYSIIGYNSTASAPPGWQSENTARFVRCGTSTGTGGNHSLGSAGSSGGGNHGSHNGNRFMRDPGGSGGDAHNAVTDSRGNHTHSVSLSHRPSAGRMKLIKLTGGDSVIPENGITFSHQTSLDGAWEHYSALDGHLLWGHSGDSYVQGVSNSAGSNNASFSHFHHGIANSSAGGPLGPSSQNRPSGGPTHSHSCSMSVSASVYAYVLKTFYATEEGGACPNLIVIFAGAVIPDGWHYCDGANGTPNLHERFIRMGTVTGAEGNGTYSVSGSLNSTGSHNHSTSLSGSEWLRGYSHDNNVSHSHSYSKSGSYTPEYRDYRFIMHTG